MYKINTKLISIDNISMSDALIKCKQLSCSPGTDIVVTPNIDHLSRLIEINIDNGFYEAYKNASLTLCDSKIFEKLLRLKGHQVKEVIPGSTLTQELFDKVVSNDDSILVIGGDNSVISKLRKLYQKLNIDHYNPPMGFINKADEVNKIIDVIERAEANFVFLAVGSPRQEVLAQKLKDKGAIDSVVLCIGASILFIVGQEKRAPIWVQKLHCEWMYRMFQDPKRLMARYFGNLIKLPRIYFNL